MSSSPKIQPADLVIHKMSERGHRHLHMLELTPKAKAGQALFPYCHNAQRIQGLATKRNVEKLVQPGIGLKAGAGQA